MMYIDKNKVALLHDAPIKNDNLAADLRAAGFAVQTLENKSRLEATSEADYNPVLVYSIGSLDDETLDFIQCTKTASPARLIICCSGRFREAKRLRLLESGADGFSSADNIQESIGGLMAGFKPPSSSAANAKSAIQEEKSSNPHMVLQLEQGELSNALQFLCMSPRVGRLDVKFAETGEQTSIFLANQTVVHAETAELTGVEAMAYMVNQPGIRKAVFYEDARTSAKSNQQPLSQFLLEASVLADEIRAASQS